MPAGVLTLDSTAMIRSGKDVAALAAAAVVAVAAACVLSAIGPKPAADVSRGSEDAFATGLHRREIPPGAGPERWTTALATFGFRDLPDAPLSLAVDIREARGPVTVAADGVLLGRLEKGAHAVSFTLPATRRATRTIELASETFRAGDGRQLGARLGRVAIDWTAPPRLPAPGLLLELLVSAAVAFLTSRLAGARAWPAGAIAIGVVVLQSALLWPSGLARSPYALGLGGLVGAGCLVALAFARAVEARHAGAGPAAFVALLAGWLVQIVAGTSPVMVTSDAVFHANKLAAVALGDLFPVSVTQHAHPFRFPYGVSFYALLAPLARAGLDTVMLVRVGAAVAGLLATAGVFLLALVAWGPAAAAFSTVLLQVLPGTFDVAYSYGNLSNAFGQDATVLLFCWWAGRAPGRWPVGAALLAAAALAHFSSFVFVMALVMLLVITDTRARDRDRTRLWAAGVGVVVAAAYYAHFLGLVWEQLPRLLEGGGQGRGASRTAWDAARLQVLGALGQWGVPAIVLAWWGRPRPRADGRPARDLSAYWLAGLALAVPAIVSPLEVRYLYGLTAAVALSAGTGVARLEQKGGARRMAGRILFLAQIALGARAIAEALVSRYRP
jgi:hypothetical protein